MPSRTAASLYGLGGILVRVNVKFRRSVALICDSRHVYVTELTRQFCKTS